MGGVKVVVRKFETDDAPDKVLDFYQKPMGKYGKVILCNGGGSNFNAHHHGNAAVSCDGSGSDYAKELKVGTENDQHVVAVKPRGKGAEFTLVYVRAHEEDNDKDTI
jgi:alcohol dehydrogenase class IV